MEERHLQLVREILAAPTEVIDLIEGRVLETREHPWAQTRRRAQPAAASPLNFLRTGNLRLMLAAAQDEFAIHYQPSVDCDTGVVTHLEALLRWPSGRVTHSTDEVIRQLESSEMIVNVGRNILARVCGDLATLRRQGFPGLTMSMNVSAGQLGDRGLIPAIEQALRRHRIPPALFQVEITETVLAESQSVDAFVRGLLAIGVGTLVDDFGLGYNNLGMLRSLPVAGLKLDRSFVAGLGKDARDSLIAETIVGLAKALQIITIAEGVETESQARWLRRQGVTRMQGWLYSKARPMTEIRTLLMQQPWVRPPRRTLRSKGS